MCNKETKCPKCGIGILSTIIGDYKFEPPPNIPGGLIIIENACWEECNECHEQIITHDLYTELDKVRFERLSVANLEEFKKLRGF